VFFDVIPTYFSLLASGLVLTIGIAAAAIATGIAIGTVTAVLRMSGVAVVRWMATTYVEVIRNTPLLVQILVVFLGLPELGIRLSAVQAAFLALSINNGAYIAEIARGGLQSVPRGQLEAAAAIGLSAPVSFLQVIFPQAMRAIYPALSNQFILTILGSSIASVIGVPELTQQVLFVDSRTFRTIELLTFLTITYGLLTLAVARGTRAAGRLLYRWGV
jgi:His/Glu/Gln/Arg/opine family amino acid ABC transporter permease subunit